MFDFIIGNNRHFGGWAFRQLVKLLLGNVDFRFHLSDLVRPNPEENVDRSSLAGSDAQDASSQQVSEQAIAEPSENRHSSVGIIGCSHIRHAVGLGQRFPGHRTGLDAAWVLQEG